MAHNEYLLPEELPVSSIMIMYDKLVDVGAL